MQANPHSASRLRRSLSLGALVILCMGAFQTLPAIAAPLESARPEPAESLATAPLTSGAAVFFCFAGIVLLGVIVGVIWLYRRRRQQQPNELHFDEATAKDAVRQIIDDFPEPGPTPEARGPVTGQSGTPKHGTPGPTDPRPDAPEAQAPGPQG